MEEFIKLTDLCKEYSKDVHIDYDRETVLLFLHKKFLPDFLVRIDKTPFNIIFKTRVDTNLLCIVLLVEDMLIDMDEFLD